MPPPRAGENAASLHRRSVYLKKGVKMKTMMRVAVAVLALGVGVQANAANVWRQNLLLKSIIASPGGVTLFLEASEPVCGPSGDQFNLSVNVNGQTADSVKMLVSIAMAALTTGRTLDVFADTAVAGCPIQLVRIVQ
jgi:hypothetical protein